MQFHEYNILFFKNLSQKFCANKHLACIYKRNIKIAVFLNNALSSFIKYLKQDFFLCFCVNVF